MISIVVGTNRPNSKSLKIAKIYQRKLTDKNVPSQLVDLNSLPEDFIFSALYKNTGKSEKFNVLSQQLALSQKVIFVIAEYNGSFSGALKAFIDGLPYPSSLTDKKVALVGLSSGMQGASLALSHFNDIMSYLGAETLALRVKIPFIEKNMTEDQFNNPLYEQLIDQQIEKLLA